MELFATSTYRSTSKNSFTVGKRESGIQKRTVDLIYESYQHVVARVKHGTAYAVVGDPDIYGVLNGKGFAFEVKNEEGKLTKIQEQRLSEFEYAGAVVGAIRTPEEAIRILNPYDV